MKRRGIQQIGLAALLLAVLPVAAFAAATTGTVAAGTPQATPSATPASTETDAQRLANLKSRGAIEIERRINNLTAAQTDLSKSKFLTSSDEAALDTQLKNELSGLAMLKTHLAADTTLAEAQADVQGIVNDYRVYVLMLPTVRMTAVSDRFTQVEQNLTTLMPLLQTRITTAESAGKSIAALQTSLYDMQAKTAAATSLTSGLAAKLLTLQPTDYNSDHTILESYRTSLGAAYADVQAARTDAESIISGLKNLGVTTSSPKPTPASNNH